MKRLQTCCCCASTRTGSIITGILGIILSIITIITIWATNKYNVQYRTFIFDEKFDKDLADRDSSYITGILGIILSIITIITIWATNKYNVQYRTFIFDEKFDKDLADRDIPRIILTVNLCFTILICGLLIVAVLKRRSWLMLPWVVLGIVLAIGLLISVLHTSITYYLDDGEDHVLIATFILVGGLIYLCIYLYLWAVVFSHYLEVRDEEERGRYRKAPYKR